MKKINPSLSEAPTTTDPDSWSVRTIEEAAMKPSGNTDAKKKKKKKSTKKSWSY